MAHLLEEALREIVRISEATRRTQASRLVAINSLANNVLVEWEEPSWEESYPKDHQYITKYACGHGRLLDVSWNMVIDGGAANPYESLCHQCNLFVDIIEFVQVPVVDD